MPSLIETCKRKGCNEFVMFQANPDAEPRGLCREHWHTTNARLAMKARQERNKRILKGSNE